MPEFISILRNIRDVLYPSMVQYYDKITGITVKNPVATVPNKENGTAGDANVTYDPITNTFDFSIPQGERGETIRFKGKDTLENIVLKSPIDQNDGWQSTTSGVMPNGDVVNVDDIIVANGTSWFNIGSLKSEAGALNYIKYVFTGITDGQSVITTPLEVQNESVYINGILQTNGADKDYTKISTSFTFSKTLEEDDEVVVIGGLLGLNPEYAITDIITIETVEDLDVIDTSIYQVAIVKDITSGSIFVHKTATEINPNTGQLYVVDSGTAFAALGGGFWARQYQGNAKYAWFDTKANAISSGLKLDFESSVTLNVPSEVATIQGALNIIGNIIDDVYVTIQVADGTYTMTNGINLNHPCGANIRLVGNETTPVNCVLQVTGEPSFNMLSCSNGNVFGYLNGFRIHATTKATLAHNFSGIIAYNGATIICGNEMEVNNFYYGINSSYNSTIEADYAKVENAGDVGIWAFCGSFISAKNAQSNYASDTINGWGFGFQAEYGSNINVEGSSATGNNIAGFASLSNSQVRALNTTSNGNIGSGYFSRGGGNIEAYGGTASFNGRYGLEIIDQTGVIIGVTTTSGNTLGVINPLLYIDNSIQALTNTSGDLRIDAKGNNHFFHGNGKIGFSINTPNSTANRIHVQANIAGVSPSINAVGSDSIIDIGIFPKGAGGYVRIGAGYTAGTIVPDNYFSVKLNDGSIVQIPCKKV